MQNDPSATGVSSVDTDLTGRIEVASALSETQTFLRTAWHTDYYTGYSLQETLQEQISRIGTGEPGDVPTTKLSRLKRFEDTALAAIKRARELGAL